MTVVMIACIVFVRPFFNSPINSQRELSLIMPCNQDFNISLGRDLQTRLMFKFEDLLTKAEAEMQLTA